MTATKKPGAAPTPSSSSKRKGSLDEHVNRLWENARKLGWSDREREKVLVVSGIVVTTAVVYGIGVKSKVSTSYAGLSLQFCLI